jgi:hypothetical protein
MNPAHNPNSTEEWRDGGMQKFNKGVGAIWDEFF